MTLTSQRYDDPLSLVMLIACHLNAHSFDWCVQGWKKWALLAAVGTVAATVAAGDVAQCEEVKAASSK
jgi:hypothetical protein